MSNLILEFLSFETNADGDSKLLDSPLATIDKFGQSSPLINLGVFTCTLSSVISSTTILLTLASSCIAIVRYKGCELNLTAFVVVN